MANPFSYFLVILLLFIFPLHNLAQNDGRVATGTSLTATDGSTPWVSPSGDFAFGFQKIQESNKDQFLLCIWYAKIQEETIVWHANVSDPIPQGSRLNLDPQRGLILVDPQGNTLWRSDLVVGNIGYGLMNDTGNFVVMGSDSTDPLWESFSNPTDTLLPNQTLERGSFLVSQKSLANFTQEVLPSNSEYDDDYYNSQTSDSTNATNSGDKLVFEENGVMYILKRNNQRQTLTPRSIPPASQNYHRVTLSFDGVLSHYYHSRNSNSSGWSIYGLNRIIYASKLMETMDLVLVATTMYAILVQTTGQFVTVPQGYSLVDPNDDHAKLALLPNKTAKVLSACLNDCFCAVAIYRSNSCWKKKLPLSNGRIDTNLNSKAFMKTRKDGVPRPLSPGLQNPGFRGSKKWQNWAIMAKNYENEESYGQEAILMDWVLDCFQEGKLEALVQSDVEALNDKKQLERFVMVGIWCIQEDPSTRPTMRKVCQMLEGSVEVTTPPCPYNISITI
ncbi:hypothetical protein HAX54_020787 [Datura stramonium]|uniref:Bulb-type lectin domain-containing protein n=1 Tax=Datura stramonium TaxID=4076 RepID=A0ABS8S2W3_DATST|nr:hypothetical protein [Datura stramonium]